MRNIQFVLEFCADSLLSSQSLAGRTALLRLLPLSLQEVTTLGKLTDTDGLILKGFMPSLHDEAIDPTAYYRNYFQTYVEKDVRQILQIRNLNAFERFMTLLAGRVGQVVNLSGLSGETGVSGTTLAEWLSILESSMTFNPDFIKPIRVFCEREKEARAPALIYAGETLPDVHGVRCVNYCTAHALLDPLHIRQKGEGDEWL